MPCLATERVLPQQQAEGFAIPAVNCISSSSINACLEAARKNDAPIMIQVHTHTCTVIAVLQLQL